MRSFKELGAIYGTDKFMDTIDGHAYGEVYDFAVGRMRDKFISILEIGVYTGASLRLWREAFPLATITGIDSAPYTVASNVIVADAYTRETVDAMPMFDVIIDDGPHTLESQLFTVREYLSHIKPGGVLIIEDIKGVEEMFTLYQAMHPSVKRHAHCIDLRHRNGRDDDMILVVKL